MYVVVGILFSTTEQGPDQSVVQHEESHSALDPVLVLVYLTLNFDLLRITDILKTKKVDKITLFR
jgi:hypothetical protein